LSIELRFLEFILSSSVRIHKCFLKA